MKFPCSCGGTTRFRLGKKVYCSGCFIHGVRWARVNADALGENEKLFEETFGVKL